MKVKFAAVMGGVLGPVGKDQKEAALRLQEYMESHIGKRHFFDVNPNANEQMYQDALFLLYEMDSGEDSEASLGQQGLTNSQR